jgi:hypothetical protein
MSASTATHAVDTRPATLACPTIAVARAVSNSLSGLTRSDSHTSFAREQRVKGASSDVVFLLNWSALFSRVPASFLRAP